MTVPAPPLRTRAALATGALLCVLLTPACASSTREQPPVRALSACDLFDPQALAADTGWALPRRGTSATQVRDGLRLSTCTLEPERTAADPTEGGLVSVELSPAAVSAAQLTELAAATSNEVPPSLEPGARNELAARWLLDADLAQALRLYGERAVPLRLPRELARGGAAAYTVPRHGVAAVVAGGRFARIALAGDGVDGTVLADVATDAARRLEEAGK